MTVEIHAADPGESGPASEGQAQPAFVWKHCVSFHETNLVGNVYFAHFAMWQGSCREMFLKTHAPDILSRLSADLKMVTVSIGIDYAVELFAFDEVELHMRLKGLTGHRIEMTFDYQVVRDGISVSAAHGHQQVACLVNDRPVPVPATLASALRRFL